MNRIPTKPRFAALPAMLFAVGLGLTFYYGDLWWRLPAYSAAEIEQSAELNLMLDLHRRGSAATQAMDESALAALREQMRAEVTTEITRERRELQRGFATGVVLALLGLVQLWMIRRAASASLVAAKRRPP